MLTAGGFVDELPGLNFPRGYFSRLNRLRSELSSGRRYVVERVVNMLGQIFRGNGFGQILGGPKT